MSGRQTGNIEGPCGKQGLTRLLFTLIFKEIILYQFIINLLFSVYNIICVFTKRKFDPLLTKSAVILWLVRLDKRQAMYSELLQYDTVLFALEWNKGQEAKFDLQVGNHQNHGYKNDYLISIFSSQEITRFHQIFNIRYIEKDFVRLIVTILILSNPAISKAFICPSLK